MIYGIPRKQISQKVKTYKEMAKKALKKVANLATTANYKRNFLLQKKKIQVNKYRSAQGASCQWSHTGHIPVL